MSAATKSLWVCGTPACLRTRVRYRRWSSGKYATVSPSCGVMLLAMDGLPFSDCVAHVRMWVQVHPS
jgi:hypothetical protein